MQMEIINALATTREKRSIVQTTLLLKFWENCTHQQLRYGWRLQDAFSKMNNELSEEDERTLKEQKLQEEADQADYEEVEEYDLQAEF